MVKKFLLVNNETHKEEYIDKNKVLYYLYKNKYSLPKLEKNKLDKLKNQLSKIDNYILLYEIINNKIFLFNNITVFKIYINLKNYRIPTKKLVKQLKTKYKENSIIIKKYKNSKKHKIDFLINENKNILFSLKFLDNFNLDILLKNYLNILENVNSLDYKLTKNPSYHSYFDYIKPYFTEKELTSFGLNNNIINTNVNTNVNINNDKNIKKIEKYIDKYYLSYYDLVEHNNYIISNNLSGIIQYYSMLGSYNLNDYLRNETKYNSSFYNNFINILSNAIINSPTIDKEFFIYRYIENNYLKGLNIGDKIVEKGFLSCSRDMFYKNKFNADNSFGYVLMKIKIPKNFNFLCIETISEFPKEQEILLPPNLTLKINNIYHNFFHPDVIINAKVSDIYELIIVDYPKKFFINNDNNEKINYFNFNIPKHINYQKINYSNKELINNFIFNYTNEYNLFKSYIGNKEYTLIAEEYNSIDAYKNIFANQTDKGFYIYSFDEKTNSLLFTLEIDDYIMYVNYNTYYDNLESKNKINDKDFLNFICKICLFFNIQKVIYYCDYVYCNRIIDKYNMFGYNKLSYNYNFYDYLKNNNKKFNFTNNKFKPLPAFNYNILDNLKKTSINILKKYIYTIDDYFKDLLNNYIEKHNNSNLAEFFIWIIDNHCHNIKNLIILYEYSKLFKSDYYIFYPAEYMVEEKIINKWPYKNIYSKDEILNQIPNFNNKSFSRIRINKDIKSKSIHELENKISIDNYYY